MRLFLNDRTTILLVDDHEVVRQGVRAFFEAHAEFEVVGEARNGAEAVKLIADGSSNTEIAKQLVICMHTVNWHVSNILSKLHLADRTQAAVYAWQKGVVRRE